VIAALSIPGIPDFQFAQDNTLGRPNYQSDEHPKIEIDLFFKCNALKRQAGKKQRHSEEKHRHADQQHNQPTK
jgi:hypothetical protein